MPGQPSKAKISFVLTGFGPFGGCENNPTTAIAQKIVGFLEQRNEDRKLEMPLYAMMKSMVLTNSAEEVRSNLDRLFDILSHQEEQESEEEQPVIIVLIHMGVNLEETKFQLERFAYNEADFPTPDEGGYHPKKELIVEDFPLQHAFETKLDLPMVLANLDNSRIRCSTDPGKFVCNYIYCYSLNLFHSYRGAEDIASNKRKFLSLFFHVPPFSAISENDQLEMVAQVMESIYQSVLNQKNA